MSVDTVMCLIIQSVLAAINTAGTGMGIVPLIIVLIKFVSVVMDIYSTNRELNVYQRMRGVMNNLVLVVSITYLRIAAYV